MNKYTIIVLLILFVPLSLSAQAGDMSVSTKSITFTFERWTDYPVQDKLISTISHLRTSLERTGFTEADTIDVLFHQRREYTVVRHNLKDPERIQILYRTIVMHSILITTILRHTRMDRFRIYVRLESGVYLETEYEDPDLKGTRVKIADKEFGF